jgi:hypothetical protein
MAFMAESRNLRVVTGSQAHLSSGAFYMTVPHKIHVKLGQNEFEAEGLEETVKDQFAMFLEAIKTVAHSPPPPPVQPARPEDHQNNGGNGSRVTTICRDVLNQVFLLDADGQVSLRVLPQSQTRDADGLLLLLFGHRVLANQTDVLSGRLIAAAETSGLTVDRVDRILSPYMDLVTKGGVKSGSRWGLRNTGVTRAEEIIHTMVS